MDRTLQTQMLRDAFDDNGDPGIAALPTGGGFSDGVGFHADLERMRSGRWRIEALSWRDSCNRRMREWAERNGRFVALDDYCDSIAFPERSMSGDPVAPARPPAALDLTGR